MSSTTSTNVNQENNGCQGHVFLKLPNKFKQHPLSTSSRPRLTPWSCAAEFDFVGRCLSHATCLFPSVARNANNSPSPVATGTASDVSNETFNIPSHKDMDHSATQNFKGGTSLSDHPSEILQELQYAIQRVSLWKIRVENGRLPHSVEVTCSLAQILLQDAMLHTAVPELQPPSSIGTFLLHNQHSIKLSYATVIIRAVNGIADSMQRNRAKNGLSVSSLCSQIGLPLWIVDLRHDSAHNELPSLVSLRLAANTLLGFFLQHYWTVLDDLRIHWRTLGGSLLKECKASCKELDRLQRCLRDNTSDQECCHDKDRKRDRQQDEKDKEEERYGMYSILMMEESNKKTSNVMKPKTSSERIKPRQMMTGRTPRQCLNEYMDKIPMDMGIEMLLEYLFHGGISDAPQGRGILIPGSPTTFPETIDSVRKMRERYSVILIYMTENWVGFLHAALKHIIHAVLLLEKGQSCGESSRCQYDREDALELSNHRKLFFLKHWFMYFISKEYFCYLKWIDVMWNGSRNIRERPREKWSEELTLFLESSVPLDALKQARLPVISFYNRLVRDGHGPVSNELAKVLVTILGKVCNSQVLQMNKELDSDDNLAVSGTKSDVRSLLLSKDDASKVTTWSTCKHWEPCAIGTLPGYLS